MLAYVEMGNLHTQACANTHEDNRVHRVPLVSSEPDWGCKQQTQRGPPSHLPCLPRKCKPGLFTFLPSAPSSSCPEPEASSSLSSSSSSSSSAASLPLYSLSEVLIVLSRAWAASL